MRLSGLVSHRIRGTFMHNANGVSQGDRNRNARLARLRELAPVTENDSTVLARRTFRCRAWISIQVLSGAKWEPLKA